jgi:hypothetical protein
MIHKFAATISLFLTKIKRFVQENFGLADMRLELKSSKNTKASLPLKKNLAIIQKKRYYHRR